MLFRDKPIIQVDHQPPLSDYELPPWHCCLASLPQLPTDLTDHNSQASNVSAGLPEAVNSHAYVSDGKLLGDLLARVLHAGGSPVQTRAIELFVSGRQGGAYW